MVVGMLKDLSPKDLPPAGDARNVFIYKDEKEKNIMDLP
jgi:hypothetical protein